MHIKETKPSRDELQGIKPLIIFSLTLKVTHLISWRRFHVASWQAMQSLTKGVTQKHERERPSFVYSCFERIIIMPKIQNGVIAPEVFALQLLGTSDIPHNIIYLANYPNNFMARWIKRTYYTRLVFRVQC